jgi:predicted DNA binding CopG/RHH family protein
MRRQGRPGSVKNATSCPTRIYDDAFKAVQLPEKRSCVIRVRLSYSQLQAFRQEAAKEGASLSELVRRKIFGEDAYGNVS